MLNIMDLEQQLINEIEERQAKLDKVRGVSPKLQQLEALLNECQSVCNEFGMQDLFISLVENFTGTIQATPTPQPQPQPQNNQNNNAVLTDKEIKVIRLELKTFLEYDGQRLNDKTAKELLIKKLEELGKQELLSEVNLDDKDNFLTESKKLINLLTLATVAKEDLTVAKEETLTVAKEEISDMTPQELGMWDALLAAGFTATELSAMATDKDTLDGFNSINGTSLTALPIAELYEYTMGVGRIE